MTITFLLQVQDHNRNNNFHVSQLKVKESIKVTKWKAVKN